MTLPKYFAGKEQRHRQQLLRVITTNATYPAILAAAVQKSKTALLHHKQATCI